MSRSSSASMSVLSRACPMVTCTRSPTTQTCSARRQRAATCRIRNDRKPGGTMNYCRDLVAAADPARQALVERRRDGGRVEWVEIMLACFRIGAVALSCTEQSRVGDLLDRLAAAEPVLVIADERNRAVIEHLSLIHIS